MRRRHKINRVVLSKRKPAFGLLTNGGSCWFIPESSRFEWKLKYYLPHIYKELLVIKPNSDKDFEALLLGRYVYGRTIKNHHKEYGEYLILA
jgi:hypothetical protein